MSVKKAEFDYIDPDVAYLIGMVVARGSFHVEGDIRRLVIQFPYRLDAMTPVPGSKINIDRETALRLSLDNIRERVSDLLEVDLRVERKEHEVSLCAVFPRATIGWRDLRFITGGKANYLQFEVPPVIYDSDTQIQKEFLRGIADTSCEPSYADRDQGDRQRIVIQVQYDNWHLPMQLCRLLQEHLQVPVSNIIYGHPNLRAPKGGSSWAKETRIRIYAESFIPIGFYFEHKQRIFEEMVDFNEKKAYPEPRFCNPKIKKVRSRKPKHSDEDSERLPECLRRHFNGYWQICKKIGCVQGKRDPQQKFIDTEDTD